MQVLISIATWYIDRYCLLKAHSLHYIKSTVFDEFVEGQTCGHSMLLLYNACTP